MAGVAGAVDAGVVLGGLAALNEFYKSGRMDGWTGGRVGRWVTLMGLMHSDGAAGVRYFGRIQDHGGPLVYVALWTSHPYTLSTQNTRYPFFLSPQLAIPTFPSSPTTSLHSSHQKSTRSKAMISAIHTVPSRPKKTPAMTPLAPMPNQGGKYARKDRYPYSLACNCSGAVLAVAATVPGPDVTCEGEA